MTATDPFWPQNIAYELNSACSAVQRKAVAWRDLEGTDQAIDPMEVARVARSTAMTLTALADQIEMKRNAGLMLEEAS